MINSSMYRRTLIGHHREPMVTRAELFEAKARLHLPLTSISGLSTNKETLNKPRAQGIPRRESPLPAHRRLLLRGKAREGPGGEREKLEGSELVKASRQRVEEEFHLQRAKLIRMWKEKMKREAKLCQRVRILEKELTQESSEDDILSQQSEYPEHLEVSRSRDDRSIIPSLKEESYEASNILEQSNPK